MLATTSYDILAFTESWWDDTVDASIVTAGTNFDIAYRNRRGNNPYGGVILIARKYLQMRVINQWENLSKIECMSAEVRMGKSNALLTVIYWPPDGMTNNIEEAQLILQWHEEQNHQNKTIVGDLNLSGLDWSESDENIGILVPVLTNARPFERNLASIFDDTGLSQCNTVPNSRGVYLDLWLCNYPEDVVMDHEIELHEVLKYGIHHSPTAFTVRVVKDSRNEGENSVHRTSKIFGI